MLDRKTLIHHVHIHGLCILLLTTFVFSFSFYHLQYYLYVVILYISSEAIFTHELILIVIPRILPLSSAGRF